MNRAQFQDLLELSWQRPLSPAEMDRLQTWLRHHPEDRQLWEEESGLNQCLEQLAPAPPVSSNFTARVLQCLPASRPSPGSWPSWVARWRPRLAGAATLVLVFLLGVTFHQKQKRQAMANDVLLVSTLARVPHPEMLKDFDTIQELSYAPPPKLVDLELLGALE